MRSLSALVLTLLASTAPAANPAPRYADRWVYCMFNLQVDKSADELIAVIDRAAKAGYTGVVLADYVAPGRQAAAERRVMTRPKR